jgi:GntR family transcriptional regulator, transcriptional repressor for pyruvate dehydrogenase complex
MTKPQPESEFVVARSPDDVSGELGVSKLEPDLLQSAPIQRVRKAYEQVYDQLRELIMTGELGRGERLPNEAILAREFGVSRGTVREALRVLAAQNLIRTAKGAGGGSFVTLPTVDHISEFLRLNISLLSESEDVTLEEFLEARHLLEVFAAKLAAERRRPEDIAVMRATLHDPSELTTEEQYVMNKDFHSAVVTSSRNTLLKIATQPIYSVLQTNLDRTNVPPSFPRQVNHDHRDILEAIEAGDATLAEQRMHDHLVFLRNAYEQNWRAPASMRGAD